MIDGFQAEDAAAVVADLLHAWVIRLCFRWPGQDAFEVEIVDYH
jgi:hypothetical protein